MYKEEFGVLVKHYFMPFIETNLYTSNEESTYLLDILIDSNYVRRYVWLTSNFA